MDREKAVGFNGHCYRWPNLGGHHSLNRVKVKKCNKYKSLTMVQYNYCIALNLMRFLLEAPFRLFVRLACGVYYDLLLLDIPWGSQMLSPVSI